MYINYSIIINSIFYNYSIKFIIIDLSDIMTIRCVSCGEEYEDDEVIYNCEKCGSVLEVEVEVDVLKVEGTTYGNTRNACLSMQAREYPLTREELHSANATN